MPTRQRRHNFDFTTLFLPLDGLDVDQHDWLFVREAILGDEVGEYSVHFEGLPRARGRYNRGSCFRIRRARGLEEVFEILLEEDRLARVVSNVNKSLSAATDTTPGEEVLGDISRESSTMMYFLMKND